MADKEIKISVKTETKDTTNALEGVKSGVKGFSDEIGIGNTQAGKMADSIKGMFNAVKAGVNVGVKSMGAFKLAVAATGIGLLVVAVAGLVNWFKKTDQGSDMLAKGMKILGQVVKEGPMMVFNSLKAVVLALLVPMRTAISTFKNMGAVLKGDKSVSEAMQDIKDDVKAFGQEIVDTAGKVVGATKNFKAANDLQQKWNDLDDERRDTQERNAQMEQKISELRAKAIDEDTTAAEKIKLLSEAKKEQAALSKIYIDDKQKEVNLIAEELKLYPDNAEWLDKQAAAKKELALLNAKGADDSKIFTKQIISANKQIATAEKESNAKREEADKKELERRQKVLDELDNMNEAARARQLAKDKEFSDERTNKNRDAAIANADSLLEDGLIDQEDYNEMVLAANRDLNEALYEAALEKREGDLELEQEQFEEDLEKRLENDEITADEAMRLREAKALEWSDKRQQIEKEEKDKLKAENDKATANYFKAEEDRTKKLEEEAKKRADITKQFINLGLDILRDSLQASLDIETDKNEKAKKDKIQKTDDTYKTESALLKNKLEKGEISEKEYAEEQAKIDAKLAEDKDKIALEFAKKQKKLDIQRAIIDGAKSILSASLTQPYIPVGLAASISAAAAATIQIVKIKNAPIAEKGGLINGARHTNGGTLIEAEDGEFIASRKLMSSPMGASLIQAQALVNQGGTPSALTEERVAQIAASVAVEVVKKVQIVQSAYDISNEVKKVNITQSATKI